MGGTNGNTWSCVKCGASGIQYKGRPRKYCLSCVVVKSKPYVKITDQEKLERRRARGRQAYYSKPKAIINRGNKAHYILNKKLARVECIVCHMKITTENHRGFHLDHRVPQDKTFALSRAYGHSYEAIDHEFTKVDLMCATCHQVKTFREGDNRHKPDIKTELQVRSLQMSLFDE